MYREEYDRLLADRFGENVHCHPSNQALCSRSATVREHMMMQWHVIRRSNGYFGSPVILQCRDSIIPK